MAFHDDLVKFFKGKTRNKSRINEIYLFRELVSAVYNAALKNNYRAHVLQIHQSYINFMENPGVAFYNVADRKKCVYCELADLMFITYNKQEIRLNFMQNKYDKRIHRNYDFRANNRQLYLLKNRPQFWLGRSHNISSAPEKILYNARYNSITNYGVFIYDRFNKEYDMEYYNADAILIPKNNGKNCVAKFDSNYAQYTTINTQDDQLNYAFTLDEFGIGLERMQIGEKYKNLDNVLEIINNETVLEYFRNIRATDVTYNPNRSSILARCVVIIDFSQN